MNFEDIKNAIEERLRSDLPEDLIYHDVKHTMDVLNAVEEIAIAENINEHDITLLKTAALLHDTGFLLQYKKNEPVGCDITKQLLLDYNYTAVDIQKICGMIMATAIPQSPKNTLEGVLCDADLDYLGRDDFYSISQRLKEELASHGTEFTHKGWLEFEISFFESHKYFTTHSLKNREPVKQKYLRELKDELLDL